MRVSSFGDDKSDLLTKGCAPQAAKDADPASGLEARVIGVIQMLVRELMVKLITPATQRRVGRMMSNPDQNGLITEAAEVMASWRLACAIAKEAVDDINPMVARLVGVTP